MEFTALEQQLVQLRSELPPEKVPVALLDFRFFLLSVNENMIVISMLVKN